MWSDFQDSQSMGLQGTTCKRKMECESESIPPSKLSRIDEWSRDQYLLPGDARYQYQSYESPPAEEYRSCYQAQQTIRCEENGKSYLDLGSWSAGTQSSGKCCEGRTSWCAAKGPSCYRQKRLSVLNLTMFKLNRYRQISDSSLHRSVLICNTLRQIEKEMEQEGYFTGMANSNNFSSCHTPVATEGYQQFQYPYEHPRAATPFPSSGSDNSSTTEDRSINWGSVLSLSSQSDLDPLNNNDSDLDDFLPSWKLSPDEVLHKTDSSDLDNIMHVLIGT